MCLKRLSLALLLVFVFSLSPIFTLEFLTSEEIAALPGLSTEKLVQIILLLNDQMINYDNSLSEKENSLNQRDEKLTLRETELEQRESNLNERESLYNLQSSLFQTSLSLAQEKARQSFFNGLTIGIVGGAGVGIYFGHNSK